MKKTLYHEHNVHDVNDLSLYEVTELYEVITTAKLLNHDNNIQYPVYSSNTQNKKTSIDIPFSMRDGAYFLTNEVLSEDNVAELISLLTNFITYSNRNNTEATLHEKAVPDYIRNICMKGRIDGGGRLMKRATRHSMDPRNPPIINGNGRIRCINGKCCLEISTKIQASMKDDSYTNTACFGVKGLMYCSCTCKAGSYDHEGYVCSYTCCGCIIISFFV